MIRDSFFALLKSPVLILLLRLIEKMAHKLRIDKRYYLLDSELNTNEPEAVNMVR